MEQLSQSVLAYDGLRTKALHPFNANQVLRSQVSAFPTQAGKIQKLLGHTRHTVLLGENAEPRPARVSLPASRPLTKPSKQSWLPNKLFSCETSNLSTLKPQRMQKEMKTCTPQQLLIIKQSEMSAVEEKVHPRKRLNSIGAPTCRQKLYKHCSPLRKRKLTASVPIKEAMKDKDWLGKAKEQIVRMFNTVLTSSNGMTVEPTTGYFKYYVGPGNNSSLIKQLMATRWWWVQVKEDERESAHFVWSQWRERDLLKRLPVQTPPACVAQAALKVSCTTKFSSSGTVLPTQQTVDLSGLHFDLISESKHYTPLVSSTFQPSQLKVLNRLNCNYELANKKNLFYHLQEYYQGQDTCIPQTFHVTSAEDEAFREFEAVHASGVRYWIVKPGEHSNRGHGIIVTNDLDVIRRQVSSNKHTYVIQKYIEQPFLVKKRKFDIRCYALVTIFNGVTQAYFYQEGYLRTATKLFTLDRLEDKFVHLTNDAIQQKSEDYGKHESANKLSYQDFQRYLDNTGHNTTDFVRDVLPQIKTIVQDTIQATHARLDPELKGHTFEVFGYDFLLDRSLKPWLLEINTNPCLDLASPQLARIIPAMLENSFRIALDPLFPEPVPQRRAGEALAENKYELIFHSAVC